MNYTVSAIVRHGGAIVLFVALLSLIGASRDVTVGTATTIVCFEFVALWSAYLVLTVFSPVNYVRQLTTFFDGSEQTEQTHKKGCIAAAIVCAVFIATHILVAGCVFGVYFAATKPGLP